MRVKESTVHVAMKGGLGNQLFQFATGVNYAVTEKKQLCLHWNHPSGTTPRKFDLEFLGIQPGIKYKVNIRDNLDFVRVKKCFMMNKDYRLSRKYSESGFQFSKIESYEHDIFIEGYFQSYLYFESISLELKNFLKLKLSNELNRTNQDTLPFVLHLRFGDYLVEPYRSVHGNLRADYYAKSLSLMGIRDEEITCISDDRKNTELLLNDLNNYKFKFSGQNSQLLDLHLISQAQNLVIANSTFSWWGAYMSQAERVIAPRKWFTSEYLRNNNTCDLFMPEWICI